MERYQRVEKPKPEQPIHGNEIRVTAQGLIRNYVTYALSLFRDKQEKEIVLKAMGQAISKAVSIAEIIKKRIYGLHQNISTSSTTITDAYEPIEEGLSPLEMKRQVSLIAIALSTVELNKNSPGYQGPSVKQANGDNQQEQQNTHNMSSTKVRGDYVGGQRQGRGRGRGRGRAWGGYLYHQEIGGYYDWGAGSGRGRGWGYRGGGYERGRGGGRGRGWSYSYVRGRGNGDQA